MRFEIPRLRAVETSCQASKTGHLASLRELSQQARKPRRDPLSWIEEFDIACDWAKGQGFSHQVKIAASHAEMRWGGHGLRGSFEN